VGVPMDYFYRKAQEVVRKYGTRDPYELLDAIGANLRFSDNYSADGLKGFAAIKKNCMFAVVNAKLDEHERRIVVGHECSHLINHRQEILASSAKALQDFMLYRNNSRLEYEANQFLADFLTSDENVLDVIASGNDGYFTLAQELHLPPELLAFKLYSMMQRDLPVRTPVELRSDFLKQ